MLSSSSVARAARGLLAACAVLVGTTREAAACSVILPDQPESLGCESATDAGAHTAAPALALQLDGIDVRRSRYAPPGFGDCGELGSVVIRFRLADGASWPTDIGVLVNHVSGEFPWFEPPVASTSAGTGWLLRTKAGEVSFLGPDDPRQPLNIHLVARLLDCAGATSSPIDVVITDPGRPEQPPSSAPEPVDGTPEPPSSAPASGTPELVNVDAGVGELARGSPSACAMSRVRRAPATWLPSQLVMIGIALALRSRRRRAS